MPEICFFSARVMTPNDGNMGGKRDALKSKLFKAMTKNHIKNIPLAPIHIRQSINQVSENTPTAAAAGGKTRDGFNPRKSFAVRKKNHCEFPRQISCPANKKLHGPLQMHLASDKASEKNCPAFINTKNEKPQESSGCATKKKKGGGGRKIARGARREKVGRE